ncbi:MAG: DNA mismatch repair protein MutS [Myxococcales bacterium]|nr:DNA mismatch repair protein MutS [Myxococcales bacterium]
MAANEKSDGAPTALMRQYLEVKARHPDALLFFRLGDFYEMFYEDAVYAARVLGLTLTSRDKGKDPEKEDAVPMCGVPHHAAQGYIAKLTELGHRVALCEQLEDPRTVKGIVKRDVVRVITPGVIIDEETLDPRTPNFVAAVAADPRDGYGVAFADVTTGDFRATSVQSREALIDELARVEPNELVVVDGEAELAALVRKAYGRLPQSRLKRADATAEEALAWLEDALGAGLPREALSRLPAVALAAARVLRYARETQVLAPLPIARLELYHRDEHLIIDEQARAHLELTATMLGGRREGSLLHTLDATCSPMGGRLLRRWLLFPLLDVAAIRRRLDAVERLVAHHGARDEVRRHLGAQGDVERLASRARLGVATPRDLVVLGRSLARLPSLVEALSQARQDLVPEDPAHDGLDLGPDLGGDLAHALLTTLDDNASASTKEGGYVLAGVSPELDELRAIASGGRDRIAEIEARERTRTGIPSLKVKFNNVFGYFIEVTKTHLASVPADYVRKQTVANAERFVTAELGEYEAKILSADERRVAIELGIFQALRDQVAAASDRLLALGAKVAAVDVLAALAEQAHRNGYVRPDVDDGEVLDLRECRHPVVERLAAAGGFVPNDVRLDTETQQLLLVTGPNMAGKSTLIRQVALSVILAQMGSFVPARSARVGVCDRVFTRVGAGDNLARGESTFLVEMRETAHILRNATRKSLVILDEIGRGTSTYDGVSIAWAVAEHLHDRVGARALFATHYHELCALSELHPRVVNVAVAAREWNGDVVFLRKLMPGGANRSFGVEVAKLAGLPDVVVARAQEILRTLESDRAGGRGPSPAKPAQELPQLGLFDGARRPTPAAAPVLPAPLAVLEDIVARLHAVQPDDLSPRAAWALVEELRKKLTSTDSSAP